MERNDKILLCALRGWTLHQIGKIFGITRERVKQIAVKTVKKYDLNLYGSMMSEYNTGSIKVLRQNKNRLISLINSKGETNGYYSKRRTENTISTGRYA